jgi:lysozyme
MVGGLLLLVTGLVSLWWFAWVPNWRPPLETGERYGVDVSAHQGQIAWNRVADDQIDFAFIKATEGADFVDRRFEENWRRAGEAGLDRGAYHFFSLCSGGAAQARHFLAMAPPDARALSPALDLELAGNCSRRPQAADVNADLGEFLRLVEEEWGSKVVLYVGDDFEGRYPVRQRLERPIWQRRFLLRPRRRGWTIWQLHGYAHVEGISGSVDLNVMRSGS